jgi:hypothetical protein
MAAQHADRRRAIEAALLEFHRMPGRHTLALRQPPLLFASIREVLQLAGGRAPDSDAATPTASVVQAAQFFVRAALLKPDADHYTLLGLTRDADVAAIKERYRSMMRLTHPDFAQSSGAAWPADAATRINQAYEVLSSPVRRREYDEANEPAPVQPATSAPAVGPASATRAPTARRGEPRRVLRHLAAGFGALGGLALAGMWVATAPNERDTLVQRTTTRIDKAPSLFANLAPALVPSAEVPQAPVSEGTGSVQAVAATTVPTAMPMSAAPAALTGPVSAASAVPMQAPALVATTPPATTAPTEATRPSPTAISGAAPAMQAPAPLAPATAVAQATVPSTSPSAAATAPAPAGAARSGPTMAEVQPLIMQVLQEVETGWGDNVISTLDRSSRRAPGAQALARQLDTLCEGVRPVKVSKVELKGEPRDGRLVVTGQVMLQVRDAASPTRLFALQAEFARQDGAPVLTRLGPVMP